MVASDGVAAAVKLVALEVVPPAVEADLDYVAGELLVGGVEAGQLEVRGDAPAIGGAKGVAVHVRDQAEVLRPTYGAIDVGLFTHVTTGPEELGVGVADVVAISPAGPQIAEHGSPSEHVVDVAHWRRV